MGSKGVGKSYVGNGILQSEVFPIGQDDSRCITVASRQIGARTVTVVDTPGPAEMNIAEVKKWNMLLKSKPLILVLVMKYFDYTAISEVPEKDHRCIQLVTENFPDLISQ